MKNKVNPKNNFCANSNFKSEIEQYWTQGADQDQNLWVVLFFYTLPYLANLLSRVLVKSQCFSQNEL
jgi:hypothetical protein